MSYSITATAIILWNKRPIGQLRQSDNLCYIVFFLQTAFPTQRALKVLAKKAPFLSHFCSLLRAPIKKFNVKTFSRSYTNGTNQKFPPLNIPSGH